MFERFTDSARDAVVRAQVEARCLGHDQIGAEHVLLAALAQPGTPGAGGLAELGVTAEAVRALLAGGDDAAALRTLGIDLVEIRRQVERAFGPGALDGDGHKPSGRRGLLGRLGSGHIPFTERAKRSLTGALRQAQTRGDRTIGAEHLLLGVLVQDGPASDLFARLGVRPEAARAAVLADLDAAA